MDRLPSRQLEVALLRGRTPEYDTKTLPLCSQHSPDQGVIRREDRPSLRRRDSPRFLYALIHFPSEDVLARCLLERALHLSGHKHKIHDCR